MSLKLLAPAKINLGLSIAGKLPNNFHEVKTIYTQISLFDLIELEEIKDDFIDFPDKRNLVYQAAKLVKEKLKVKRGVKIRLTKKIPIGSGLGGGSSDAAAVLKGLNKLWRLNLGQKKLIEMAKKLGSDVAYQIIGGTKLEFQGGEKAGKFMDLGKLIKGWIVVCVPEIFISSKEAYQKIEYDKIGKTEVLWHNDFEIWSLKQYPEIKKIKESMIKNGAEKSLMSGKGSAVFGIFTEKKEAEKAYNHLKQKYKKTYILEPIYD
ncbi:MAG: 4-(cytidine 5'-diphospho)-2-C-methyl-D-erythritol kinase [Candidatus Beckwithbacteria bacterium]|nr:4-(cytidine 5'-diphospho)-2-C-methyl-D-erythritol kinase [Candidatus Beckwithbacteria bacterium]